MLVSRPGTGAQIPLAHTLLILPWASTKCAKYRKYYRRSFIRANRDLLVVSWYESFPPTRYGRACRELLSFAGRDRACG